MFAHALKGLIARAAWQALAAVMLHLLGQGQGTVQGPHLS